MKESAVENKQNINCHTQVERIYYVFASTRRIKANCAGKMEFALQSNRRRKEGIKSGARWIVLDPIITFHHDKWVWHCTFDFHSTLCGLWVFKMSASLKCWQISPPLPDSICDAVLCVKYCNRQSNAKWSWDFNEQ